MYSKSILLLVMEMGELRLKIPDELGKEIEELPEMEEMLREFIRLKVFELELKRFKELQRFVFDALASKSKLTMKDAMELGKKVNEGMLKELEDKGLV